MTEIRNILCPVDRSDISLRALYAATDLAKWHGARLRVVEVVGTSGIFVGRAPVAPLDAREWRQPEDIVVLGRPAEEIVRIARRRAEDVIVLGVHGRNALDLALFGSTTHRVVREAPCPVLTVRSRK